VCAHPGESAPARSRAGDSCRERSVLARDRSRDRAAVRGSRAQSVGGSDQYLTEGHGDRAGDSGGPVWTRYGLDELAIVGIWLGTHNEGDDTINGRFYPLPEALQNLGLAANPL
jgi:hypothetical protein